MSSSRTFAQAASSPAHRSFWRAGLQRRAGAQPLDDWLIEQANLRGFNGAFVVPTGAGSDPQLSLEDIVVGLCAPHADADGRVFKLVVRILQSGEIEPRRLRHLARLERADGVLHWLLQGIPDSERNEALQVVGEYFETPPRGYRPLDYRYDFTRLVKRPFRREAAWTRRPAS